MDSGEPRSSSAPPKSTYEKGIFGARIACQRMMLAVVVLAANLSAAPMTPQPTPPPILSGSAPSEPRQSFPTTSVTDAPEPRTYLIVGVGLILVSVATARLRRRP